MAAATFLFLFFFEEGFVITVNKPHVSSSRVDELVAHPAEYVERIVKT